MTTTPGIVVVNRLLAGLTLAESRRILTHCETLNMSFGTRLCEPNEPLEYAYFPLTSFISLVTELDDHPPLEVGLIGNEGMLGATLALGTRIAPLRAVVQGPGLALRIPVAQLEEQLGESTALLSTLKRYLYTLIMQLSQSAACTHFHAIEPRLARWLLMTHDRAHADHFHLTHEFLAEMLGVRRSGVTIAASALQGRHLIHYSRGEIKVIDRKGLEAAACKCYAAMLNTYGQLVPEKNTLPEQLP